MHHRHPVLVIEVGLCLALLTLYLAFGTKCSRFKEAPGTHRANKKLTALRPTPHHHRTNLQKISSIENGSQRHHQLDAYIHQLKPAEFEPAFKALIQTSGKQRPREAHHFIRIWAEKSPLTAWEVIEPMFDFVVPFRYADSWEQHLLPPKDLEALAASPFWPEKEFFSRFYAGFAASDLPEPQKSQLESAFFREFAAIETHEEIIRLAGSTFKKSTPIPPQPDEFIEPQTRPPTVDQALAAADNDRETFSDLAYPTVYNLNTADEVQRTIADLEKIPLYLTDGDAAQAMESWGDIDLESTARFGVNWLLKSGDYPVDQTLKIWQGENNPTDGGTADRTFGCLRCWALTEPEKMQSWINTQQDPEVRKALQWLKDHPNGK